MTTTPDDPAPPWVDAIDVHHHLVPDAYRQSLARCGVAAPISGVEFPDWSVEASLAMMDRQGIATAMLSLSVPGVAVPDAADAAHLAREVNKSMRRIIDAHPGRFGAFAAVPLPDVPAALAEIDHAIGVLGLDGVGLFTNYGRVYLGDPAFDPVLAHLDRRGAVAFVHPAAPPDGSPVDLPDSVCEFPFATTRMAAQMVYNGTFSRYPHLRLILPHAGGTIPYLAERMTYAPVIRPSMASLAPDDALGYLRSLYFDTAMSGNAHTLAAFRSFADPSHILVGTDFPFMPAWSSRESGERIRGLGRFTEGELTAVARGNAEALFPRLIRQAVPVPAGR